MGHPCPVCDIVGAVLLCHGTAVGQSCPVVGQSCSVMGQQWDGPALSWTAVGQGVDERMIIII